MLRQLVQFEHKIEDFIGHFTLSPNTPTPLAKEMLIQFLKYVGEIEDKGKAAMEVQAAQEAPKETEEQSPKAEELNPNG